MTAAVVHREPSTEVPTSRMGIWFFLASEVLIFGGLIVIYILMRSRHPEWGQQAAHTIDAAGAINTMILLTSSFSAVLAHKAAAEKLYNKAAGLLALTVLGGFGFLCVKTYEYTHEIAAGYTPVTNLFWSFYYLMTGLHGLHVILGMCAMIYIAFDVRRGRHVNRVEFAGMYWHLVDVVWIFLFPLLYLAS